MHLNLLVIKTNRLEEQVQFYKTLGIEFTQERHGNGPYHYAGTIDGLTFELYSLSAGVATPDNTTRLGFTIADLDNTLLQLTALGLETIQTPAITEWGYVAVVKDFDGRKVELMSAL